MELSNKRTQLKKTCEKHGPYISTQVIIKSKTIESGCPVCAEEIRELEWKERQQELVQEAIQRRFKRAGVPKRYRGKTIEGYEAKTPLQTKAKNVCERYIGSFDEALATGRSLVLTGKTGTGKTHLANAIANQVIESGREVLYITVRELVGQVKETWRKSAEQTERTVIKNFVDVDLLLLDEVGVQFDTDAERMIMFDVINGRYENVKPTIVISNLAIDSKDEKEQTIRKVLGDRVLDRLREGGGTQISFDWESHRVNA